MTAPGPWDGGWRLCLPLAAWPAVDRACWAAATRRGDLLLDDGPAAHLKPGSLGTRADGYGRWLAWLAEGDRLDPGDDDPAARATPERVAAYVAALRRANAPSTVLNRVADLATVLRWFAPGRDRDWLGRVLAKLRGGVRAARDKRARLRSAHELLALGHRLMRAAETASSSPPPPSRERARLYRDGLMIAFLAARPLRLANLVRLELGRDLVRRGQGWWLEIPGAGTKTGEPVELPFPEDLVPALEAYLAAWRPLLARPGRAAGSDALWLTWRGAAISGLQAYARIVARTRAAFGRPVNPHLFRDAAATTVALDRPEQVRLTARLLGHRSFATTERHYNLARASEAAAAWHGVLEGLAAAAPATTPGRRRRT